MRSKGQRKEREKIEQGKEYEMTNTERMESRQPHAASNFTELRVDDVASAARGKRTKH
jgi:hypothetical protein